MVADTNNKKQRGRPKLPDTILREKVGMNPEMSRRQYQNRMYAVHFICEVLEENHPFFRDERGNMRRQGIAEQLGRMYMEGLISKNNCKKLLEYVIDDYNNGTSVKEISSRLSFLRKKYKKERMQ